MVGDVLDGDGPAGRVIVEWSEFTVALDPRRLPPVNTYWCINLSFG